MFLKLSIEGKLYQSEGLHPTSIDNNITSDSTNSKIDMMMMMMMMVLMVVLIMIQCDTTTMMECTEN